MQEGYAASPIRESVTRMVDENLRTVLGHVVETACRAGRVTRDPVPEYHLRLLRLDREFRQTLSP